MPMSGGPQPLGPSRWDLRVTDPDARDDLLLVGGDLEPETIVAAYRAGLFPMGLGPHGGPPIGWWSPLHRGVLLPGDHHVSRSLRRSRGRFAVRFDTAFEQVVARCADPSRSGRWITPEIAAAYVRLHDVGWAHSVEAFDEDSRLVGGLYGVQLGGLFAGESMFHLATDAGKVALWALVDWFFGDGDPRRIIDVQWQTPHLATQGVREIHRRDYLRRLADAVQVRGPE